MAFVPDYTKTPKEIMLALLNEAGGLLLITDQLVEIGPPVVPSNPATLRETQITITAKPDSGITGQKTMKYNRVDFAIVPGVRSTKFERGDAATVQDLIPAINAAYRLNLQPEDFVDAPLPSYSSGDPDRVPFTLTAKSTSYCFVGSVELATRRRNLMTVGAGEPGLMSPTPFTETLILEDLKDNYGAVILPEDLEPFTIPNTTDGEIHVITLTAAADSPRWYGSVQLALVQYDVDPLGVLVHETMPAALP